MKVLHVIPSVSPKRGGPSQTIRLMGRGLMQAGVEVHVATTDDDGSGRASCALNEPLCLPDGTFWHFSRELRSYTVSRPLCLWLGQHVQDFDLIHIHSLFSYPTTVTAHWARRRGVPYVVRPLGSLTLRGIRRRHRWLKRLSVEAVERRILRGATWVHFATELEREDAGWLKMSTPSRVIPNPVIAPPRHLRESRAGQTILFLSRLDPIKGLDLLLPAFAHACHRLPAARLIVAGTGESEFVTRLRAMADSLPNRNQVEWAGFVDGPRKEQLFQRADLFVLPSYSESFGMAAAEAMSHGLPILASDKVGISPLIRSYAAGCTVPCRTEEIEEALVALLQNPSRLREMGANGRGAVESELSPVAIGKQLKREYAGSIARE